MAPGYYYDPRPEVVQVSRLELGKLVKEYRLKSGFSQERLSEETNLTVYAIDLIECGVICAHPATLNRIGEVIGVYFQEPESSWRDPEYYWRYKTAVACSYLYG